MISYFLWSGSPEIFALGPISLRWYGLLFASGFLISQQILYYIYKEEGKPQKDVDTLTVYMVIATILGARFGHVLFYQPEILLESPLSVILPFEFSPFRFTGFQGLASHGGAIGILIALWIYANYAIDFSKTVIIGSEKKIKRGVFFTKRSLPGQSYLQVLDRMVIVVALTGCLIRVGNFFNSEIIGKPTESFASVVFTSPLEESILKERATPTPVSSVVIKKNDEPKPEGEGRVPIAIYLIFNKGVSEPEVANYINGELKYYMANLPEFYDEPFGRDIRYQISQDPDGTYLAKVSTIGIGRHPAQLYEAGSCLLLFIILFWYWSRWKANLPPGRFFGAFLVILWSLRFAYEYLKENQVSFEDSLPFNMGQILSIPLILVGLAIFIWSYRKPSTKE